MTITLTTAENQKNSTDKNVTTIDLGDCEDILRKHYKLSSNDTLFIKKIDVVQEGMKIPKIVYDVYHKVNNSYLVKLNLTVWGNSKLFLFIPVEVTESLDKLNSRSR